MILTHYVEAPLVLFILYIFILYMGMSIKRTILWVPEGVFAMAPTNSVGAVIRCHDVR